MTAPAGRRCDSAFNFLYVLTRCVAVGVQRAPMAAARMHQFSTSIVTYTRVLTFRIGMRCIIFIIFYSTGNDTCESIGEAIVGAQYRRKSLVRHVFD